jgi:hypothetical protein
LDTKNINKLLDIISENPKFFSQGIIIDGKCDTFESFGIVTNETKILTSLDNTIYSGNILLARIIQSIGLFNEFLYSLSLEVYSNGVNTDLIPNKQYYLKIEISHETVRIIKREGFGLIFYKMGDMYNVLRAILNEYKNYFLSSNLLTQKEKEILNAVVQTMNHKTKTDDLMVSFVSLIN